MKISMLWLWRAATLASVFLPTKALYFYMDESTPKCFFEELPKDTLVVGNFEAARWSDQKQVYEPHGDMVVEVAVYEVFDNDHRTVFHRASSKGRLTFTAADSGDHRICFSVQGSGAGGWLSGSSPRGQVKFTLDLAIGETSAIESTDKGKMQDIAQKVKDLNSRLHDIRREQVFQREREAEFRDQSEMTNSRVVRWTLIQLAVLGITCAWQLSHLRAFFIKQKLT